VLEEEKGKRKERTQGARQRTKDKCKKKKVEEVEEVKR